MLVVEVFVVSILDDILCCGDLGGRYVVSLWLMRVLSWLTDIVIIAYSGGLILGCCCCLCWEFSLHG